MHDKVKGGCFFTRYSIPIFQHRGMDIAPADDGPTAPSPTEWAKEASWRGSTTRGPFPCEVKRRERKREREIARFKNRCGDRPSGQDSFGGPNL